MVEGGRWKRSNPPSPYRLRRTRKMFRSSGFRGLEVRGQRSEVGDQRKARGNTGEK
jgi:hypothetical protein